MATATEDLVLRVLRDIQGTLAKHGRKLSKVQSGQSDIRESIVTALGLAAHANVRNDLMEDRLGKPEGMVDEVDRLKERVDRLETERA